MRDETDSAHRVQSLQNRAVGGVGLPLCPLHAESQQPLAKLRARDEQDPIALPSYGLPQEAPVGGVMVRGKDHSDPGLLGRCDDLLGRAAAVMREAGVRVDDSTNVLV